MPSVKSETDHCLFTSTINSSFSGMQHQTAAVGSLSIELALRRIRE
jgi:hypothetical protein